MHKKVTVYYSWLMHVTQHRGNPILKGTTIGLQYQSNINEIGTAQPGRVSKYGYKSEVIIHCPTNTLL